MLLTALEIAANHQRHELTRLRDEVKRLELLVYDANAAKRLAEARYERLLAERAWEATQP